MKQKNSTATSQLPQPDAMAQSDDAMETDLEWEFDNRERMENLSYAIGYYRKKKGYSQEQMAEQLGISRQHLASVEAPGMNRGLSLELLFNIATVLEIEPYVLLKFRIEK